MQPSEIEVGGVYTGGGERPTFPLRVVSIGPVKRTCFTVSVTFEGVHESADMRSGGCWPLEKFARWAVRKVDE